MRTDRRVNGKRQTFTYPVKLPTSPLRRRIHPAAVGHAQDRLPGRPDAAERHERGADEGDHSAVEGVSASSPNIRPSWWIWTSTRPAGGPLPTGRPVLQQNERLCRKTTATLAREGGAIRSRRMEQVGASGGGAVVNTKADLNAVQAAPTNGNFIMNEAGQRVQLVADCAMSASARSCRPARSGWM